MMFFAKRSSARSFASVVGSKCVDMGAKAAPKRRWAVVVVKAS